MLALVLAFVVLPPFLVLSHELGHALVGLARTDGLVQVVVGKAPARWALRRGRLVLGVNPTLTVGGEGGRATTYASMAPRDRIAYAIAGPAAQAAASLGVVLAAADLHVRSAMVVGAVGLVLAPANLIPHTLKSGLRSDGAAARAAWRELRAGVGSPIDDLADTRARWYALFTDQSNLTELRAFVFGVAGGAVGYARTDPTVNATAISHLARAGWCWRAAERGDTTATRQRALDAVHAATLTGVVEPKLTAVAALHLAHSRVELCDRRGLARLPAAVRPSSVPLQRQWDAFRFGAALYDVEAARAV